jgi:hypothetical protein
MLTPRGTRGTLGRVNPVTPLPASGEVFLDTRGAGRALRVSWHREADVVVLSLWSAGTCTGTFRLPVEDVPDLIETLREGLDHPSGRPGVRRRDPGGERSAFDAGLTG